MIKRIILRAIGESLCQFIKNLILINQVFFLVDLIGAKKFIR